MTRLFSRLVVVWILVARPTPMHAQTHGYDDNALRIEGRFGDIRVVRGAAGVFVGKLGTFGGIDLAKLVGSSERATLEARQFGHNYWPGTAFLSAGIVTLGMWMGVSRINDVNPTITTGLLVGATGLIVYGGGRLQSAYNALARSIWWYNRDLRD